MFPLGRHTQSYQVRPSRPGKGRIIHEMHSSVHTLQQLPQSLPWRTGVTGPRSSGQRTGHLWTICLNIFTYERWWFYIYSSVKWPKGIVCSLWWTQLKYTQEELLQNHALNKGLMGEWASLRYIPKKVLMEVLHSKFTCTYASHSYPWQKNQVWLEYWKHLHPSGFPQFFRTIYSPFQLPKKAPDLEIQR